MPESSGTSFIPKNSNRVRKPRTNKRIYIFSYITYVLFFGTLLTLLGSYVYSVQVGKNLERQKQELATKSETFSDVEIAYVRDLEKRLLVAERLVNESSAPSRLFDALEAVIADTVAVVEFTYEREANSNFVLTFSGAMNEFDSAAFQRDLFAAAPALANATVSEYTYGTPPQSEVEGQVAGSGRRLVVTFESTGSTALFPFEPEIPSLTIEESATTSAAESTDTGPATSTANQ
ncbi:MAG: hypothetical protein WDZ93_00620 [Candidatus Paceibacterota bacterium]